MRVAIWRIASTAPEVEFCTARMWLAISSVALAVCTASDLTSDATTAKPLPASPARAASMVALSASRLVWPAMLRISLTTSPIFCAPAASPAISPSVARASPVARPTMLLVWLSWRLISAIECDNSSAATAAVSTLVEASLNACTALSARCEVCSEEPNNAPAVERMAVALSLTLDSSFSTCGRNEAIAVSTLARRCPVRWSAARSSSARRCSVTSSWVETQPPSGSGSFLASTMRPSLGLHIDAACFCFSRCRRRIVWQ